MKKLFLAALLLFVGLANAQIILTPGTTVSVTCPTSAIPTPAPPPPPPSPVPTPVPPGPPQPADRCASFAHNALLYSYCMQGAANPAPTGDSSNPNIPTSGFVIQGKGNVLRNRLSAAQVYDFILPASAVGEVIYFKHGEMPGTPDSMRLMLTILGPQGQVLHGPILAGSRFWSTMIQSPGGQLIYRLVPNEDGWLIVTRN